MVSAPHPRIVPALWLLVGVCIHVPTYAATHDASIEQGGIHYACSPGAIKTIAADMSAYLRRLGIAEDQIVAAVNPAGGSAQYTLNTPAQDTVTLDLKNRPALQIRDETVSLPASRGKFRQVTTVSRKEILLSLMQHGRLTEFRGRACNVAALRQHVELRQNIAAWGEELYWVWPDGEAAAWNATYWQRGTPLPGHPLREALMDVFVHPERYAIGCYTASKLVMVQGVLDYFGRVRPNHARLQRIERRLQTDGEPLAGIEPRRMWDFEADFDPTEAERPGKLLTISDRIAPGNFVAGDWVHLRNTDPQSYLKTGYEGSNPIYLGRNRFSDYFNDHGHAYSYEQKLDEVYQWRNGVFSRSRHASKIQPLSPEDYARLALTPAQGGLQTDRRTGPYFFGFETLPPLPATTPR